MRTFNLHSFWRSLCWITGTRRHKLLTLFTGSLLTVFVIETMLMWTAGWFGDPDAQTAIYGIMICCSLGFFVYWAASQTFADFGDKQTAIIELMHPASNLEKFAAHWTYQIVVYGAAVTLGIALGDLLRAMLEFAAHGFDASSFSPLIVALGKLVAELLRHCPDWMTAKGLSVVCCGIAEVLWVHSVYVLGSVFFRRHRFLFTSLLLFVVQLMPFSLAPTTLSVPFGLWFDTPYDLAEVGYLTQLRMATLIHVALIVFNYWAAFRLFTRMQVISNRRFNW